MNVRFVAKSTGVAKDGSPLTAEEIVTYSARVSSPDNQLKHNTASRLLSYLIKHKHWSPFEMATLTLEITTSRAISAQIIRHRSFSYQEFSQRYSKTNNIIQYSARRQDLKNRQNSLDDMDNADRIWFQDAQRTVNYHSTNLYNEALARGIAKEQARFLLPMASETTLFMTGSVRSWIHYLQLRTDVSTQLEHRIIAEECKKVFCEHFPNIAKAMEWLQ